MGVCAWYRGGVVLGGVPDPGRGVVLRGVPGGDPPHTHTPLDGYCCGWYASYWNAFLFTRCLVWSKTYSLSGYHADTPITIKAEVSCKADSRIH